MLECKYHKNIFSSTYISKQDLLLFNNHHNPAIGGIFLCLCKCLLFGDLQGCPLDALSLFMLPPSCFVLLKKNYSSGKILSCGMLIAEDQSQL